MTEAERTALIHQINRHAHLNDNQMGAVLGALRHLKWEPKMNKNSDLMSTAPLPNYNAPTPVRCEPPVPDPHAALKEAVVEAAMSAYYNGWLPRHIDEVAKSCAALAAAQIPPNPAKELRRAMAAVTLIGPSEAAAHMEIAINRAIAALEQGNAA